jgi:hypothetical protein
MITTENLKIILRMGAISVESSFSTLDVMLSGPADLYGFKFDSNIAFRFQ